MTTFLDNVTFPQARADLNAAFNALDTQNAGATAPTDFQAFTLWLDTSGANPILKQRNASNTDWVAVVIDEDDFASNSAEKAPSQQSVKAYIDGQKVGKNRLINGGFSVDQRNNGAAQTITAAATKAYTVDRFYAYCTGANVTGQRVAGSLQSQYRYQFTGAGGNTSIQFGQRIEAANSYDLNDQTCTLSVDLSNSILTTVTWEVFYANTTDTFGTIASPTRTSIATGTFTVTSTINRYSVQIAVPSAATTGIEVVFSVANQTSGTWTIGNVQFEKGAIATEFEQKDDQQQCESRYHESTVSVFGYSVGAGGSIACSVPFKTTMKSTPVVSSKSITESVGVTAATYSLVSKTGAKYTASTGAAGVFGATVIAAINCEL